MTQPSIFDRLRSMQTEGLPLHTLIVEACEVGNELVAALEYVRENLGTPVPIGRRHVARRVDAAIARAYSDSNGNGSNGSNRSAA